jgi:hypothetical protein
MPDFDRLHDLSSRLAKLTAPGEQEPGLISWGLAVGPLWRDIAEMWEDSPPVTLSWPVADSLERLEKRLATVESVSHKPLNIPDAPWFRDLAHRVSELERRVARIIILEADLATTPPSSDSEFRHPFEPIGRSPFCSQCGGGKDHPIHQGGTHAR